MRKKVYIILGSILCVLVVGFAIVYYNYIKPMNAIFSEVRNMKIEDVDLNKIENGIYLGDFRYSTSYCKVEVTVLNKKIVEIKIIDNDDSEYAKKAEAVISKVIEEQKINVDAISGATTTSKALLKATENALFKKEK